MPVFQAIPKDEFGKAAISMHTSDGVLTVAFVSTQGENKGYEIASHLVKALHSVPQETDKADKIPFQFSRKNGELVFLKKNDENITEIAARIIVNGPALAHPDCHDLLDRLPKAMSQLCKDRSNWTLQPLPSKSSKPSNPKFGL